MPRMTIQCCLKYNPRTRVQESLIRLRLGCCQSQELHLCHEHHSMIANRKYLSLWNPLGGSLWLVLMPEESYLPNSDNFMFRFVPARGTILTLSNGNRTLNCCLHRCFRCTWPTLWRPSCVGRLVVISLTSRLLLLGFLGRSCWVV